MNDVKAILFSIIGEWV